MDYFALQVIFQAFPYYPVVSFLGDLDVITDNIDSFQFTVTDNAVNNAFREFQFLGNIFDCKPVIRGGFPDTVQHVKELAQIIEQLPAGRTAFAVCMTCG